MTTLVVMQLNIRIEQTPAVVTVFAGSENMR